MIAFVLAQKLKRLGMLGSLESPMLVLIRHIMLLQYFSRCSIMCSCRMAVFTFTNPSRTANFTSSFRMASKIAVGYTTILSVEAATQGSFLSLTWVASVGARRGL